MPGLQIHINLLGACRTLLFYALSFLYMKCTCSIAIKYSILRGLTANYVDYFRLLDLSPKGF